MLIPDRESGGAMQELVTDVRKERQRRGPRPTATPDEEEARDDDARVTGAISAGDVGAFESVYDRYAPQAFGLALRISRSRQIAEESVQDAFLSLWNRPGSYRPGRGSLLAYLLRIVHNKTVDAVRHEESLRRRTLAAENVQEDMDDGGLTELAWEALRRHRVRATLQLLSDVQRESLELAYFGGLTMSEVAGTLGIPLGTAKTRIRDGMIRLRSLLSSDCWGDTWEAPSELPRPQVSDMERRHSGGSPPIGLPLGRPGD
jgi:RNA polymerase sigma-70 factor (ECF subfamily)